MIRCSLGGKTDSGPELIRAVFDIDGDPLFSRSSTERVRRIANGATKPITSMQVEVFASQ